MKCSGGEIHVWRIELDGAARTAATLRAALSPEETERASRFRTAELRERWTAARGALRSILASYTGCEPEALIFKQGSHGKLSLEWPVCELAFNLTHTGGLALVAVGNDRRVGIDAETVRADVDMEELSRRFFAPEEAEEILAMSPEVRLAAFFRCWSRKEAIVKALGCGLSVALDSFRVSVRADEPARLIWANGEISGQWSLLDVSEVGVAAAVAVEGSAPVLRQISFVPGY
ncbi:MAG TPA: 4'-phosphopantetheinyl transferase superfamily protein [Candidatus Saccharimonadales bacterium]|nr:4'-phosphopantetheinyl transferase superfamily protein [Candidatus Saccharimonadales bacterium]